MYRTNLYYWIVNGFSEVMFGKIEKKFYYRVVGQLYSAVILTVSISFSLFLTVLVHGSTLDESTNSNDFFRSVSAVDVPIGTTSLDGAVSDDGLPLNSVLSINWSQVSGPAPVTFADPNDRQTSVSFFEVGTYVLKLEASDGELSSSDTVTITIRSAPFNQWLTAHFTEEEMADTSLSGDLADPDIDGIINLIEYALGLDPRLTSMAGQPLVQFNGTHLDFQLTRLTTRTDLTYEVLASNNLESGWSVIARSIGGAAFVDVDGGTASIDESGSETVNVTVTDSVALEENLRSRFMKLRVLQDSGG
ncbi:PKD domain-containing protein [Rubellicoccus peritrichatus]|uniref:PKD domain-containing protein n=1 Tax=Rubellicoccus peritrichatus TaxID=3080537 RepID=A0AAQ3QTU0_9BACT|nr:hypothetical protein [Puniceicoccus sp. CR14]WOO39753.1 hypothetical protein RZN69_14105 [Puniceicoccus sp. CR14]